VGVIHPPLHPLPSREGKFSDTLQLAAGWFIPPFVRGEMQGGLEGLFERIGIV